MIALFSIIAVISFSLTISTDEALSLRELDYDRDGVLDEFDECLTAPETYNKFEELGFYPLGIGNLSKMNLWSHQNLGIDMVLSL